MNALTSTAARSVDVRIVSAFTRDGAGGNPAGVVVDADGLTDADMMAVAAKVGLSETAFVSSSSVATVKLDFFTPTRRIAHCGHATIATFAYLAEAGRVGEGNLSKETVDGPRKIIVSDGMAFMEQLAPKYSESSDWKGVDGASVLQSLGVAADALDPRARPVVVNTGNGFMLVGLKSKDDLAALRPDFAAIEAISEALDLIGYYVFTTDVAPAEGIAATTRMFAPRYGIEEEAATGMAGGPLACLLYDRLDVRSPRLLIEQGRLMAEPSPSLLEARLNIENGGITGLMVGGRAQVKDSRVVPL